MKLQPVEGIKKKTECLHPFLHSDNQLMSSEVKYGGLKICVV